MQAQWERWVGQGSPCWILDSSSVGQPLQLVQDCQQKWPSTAGFFSFKSASVGLHPKLQKYLEKDLGS